MRRVGLALSGGGFRATLYHLGVLRFLRDAGILPKVSHITSVSGGSIMAAHLVLNWQRYTGSDQEYEEAAGELLDFIRFDIRNRVVRRFPLAFAANSLLWLVKKGRKRKLTRPGLLEAHYERYLYGDKCLYELPALPQLHILATNVNEGGLCSFTRAGILEQRRVPGGGTRFEPVPSGLTTVSMAVAASSAFPGFFPPLQLTAHDVGAEEGRFPPHLFTDGGVFDNLGVRMFRHIRKSWIGHDCPLRPDDFADLPTASEVLLHAAQEGVDSPLGRLGRLLEHRAANDAALLKENPDEALAQSLWSVIVHDRLYLEPAFQSLVLEDEHLADLCRMARRGRELEYGDHLRLNQNLANSAFATAQKAELFHSTNTEFDAVIVSDAGKPFAISRRTSGGGLVGTAMRSTDILMDRVWQLENEHFGAEPDFVFAPMSLYVDEDEDPTALHPELQQQVTRTRTDLDRFSELEISGLIRHGYGVMRKVCRSRVDLFGEDLPTGPPWDPTTIEKQATESTDTAASHTTQQARTLQESAHRQILGRLLNLRDWPTYVYVPLLLLLFVGLPYFAVRAYNRAHRSELIVDAITYSNPDFQLVLQLARDNPVPGDWETLEAEEVPELQPVDFNGFQLVTDTRVFDLRAWQPDSTDLRHRMINYRRMQVRRIVDNTATGDESEQESGRFRIQQFGRTRDILVRCDARHLHPVLRLAPHTLPSGDSSYLYEIEFDLSAVPVGQDFYVGFELTDSGLQGRSSTDERLFFPMVAPTDVATMWVLLPSGRRYRAFELFAHDPANPGRLESVEPTYNVEMTDGSLFGWMLVAPNDDTTYETRWAWREN